MAIDTTPVATTTSRRALLAGVGGAVIGLAAQALGKPLPARAEGEAMVVGGDYTDATSTTLIASNSAITVFKANSLAAGVGVSGFSSDGTGVQGVSEAEIGIGVLGVCYPGVGTYGLTKTGTAVYAQATSGQAIRAFSESGHALRTEGGRVKFQQVSGVATIPAGSTVTTITPAVNIVNSSFVLLTPRVNLGGRDLWYTTDPSANSFHIHINPARTSDTPLGWLLLG